MELMFSKNPITPPTTYEKPVAKPTHSLGCPRCGPTPSSEAPTGKEGILGHLQGPSSHVSPVEIGSRPSSSPLLSPSQLFLQASLTPYGSPDLRPATQPTPKIVHMIPFCIMYPKWSTPH